MQWLLEPASVPVLAMITTFHLSFLLLLHHRSGSSSRLSGLLLPSVAFAAAPWVLPTTVWLAVGLAAHLAWFVACDKLVPKPAPPARSPETAPRPVAPAQRPAPAPRVAAAHLAKAPAAAAAAAPQPGGPVFTPQPVLAVFQETEDIKTFRVLRPNGHSFTAGQFMSVRVQVDGKPLVRCYSISSAPEAAGYLEFSVKKLGQVSAMLHATIRPGSMLAIKGPAGRFTYPQGDDRPIVLLAGGVGITPLMSMFRHGVVTEPMRPITMVLAVRNERQVTFRRELEWLDERHPQARVAFVIQEGPFTLGDTYRSGFVNEALLREVVPDIANSIYLLCGPGPMMDAMRKLLAALAVPESQVRWEEFDAAIALSKEPTPRPGQAHAHVSVAAVAAPVEPALVHATPTLAAADAEFLLTLQQSALTVSVQKEQTILEAVEAAGAFIPTRCRAGICMACRTRLVAGDAHCDSDSLDDQDRADGYILPCVSWAKSDCVLEA